MTTEPNSHDFLREQAPFYALGNLSDAERSAFETHLNGCAQCKADVTAFLAVCGALAQTVEQHDPPAALRRRILGAARRAPEAPYRLSALAPWFAAAAMLVVTAPVAVQGYAYDALRAAADAQTPLAILTAPDLQRIDLAGQPAAPRASARAFWSRSRGLVLTGANLPSLPPGRVYQLWFVTAQAPVSAGLLKPDETGRLTSVLDTPSDIPAPAALAVTIEPEGGSPGPTGAKYLVGLAH